MAQIDLTRVRFGLVDRWIPTTKEGRHYSGGYGWVRGKGQNAGKAFVHVTDFARVEYNEREYRLGYSKSSGEVPSTLCPDDEVALALEEPTPPKGPKAEWWATRKNYDAALEERRAHLLTRHTDNDDGNVTEVQFYIDLNGTEVEVGRQTLPVCDEMKFHDSPHWSARAEEFEDGLWLVQRQSPIYEFLRTQIREVAQLPTGVVTKFEMTRIPGENGWVYAPHERRFRPTNVEVRPADNYNHERAMKPIIGYGQFVVKVSGVDPDGNAVEVNFPNPSRAASTDHYVHKDVWNWLEVPAELRQDFYRRFPVCKCRKARHEAAKYTACRDCIVRAEYGVCACGRTVSFFNGKVSGQYYCASVECKARESVKSLEMLREAVKAEHLAKIAEEGKRLLRGRVVVSGADQTRDWLEAKALELIPDDGYSNYKRERILEKARFDYRNSNPVAVIELEGGYWASHVSRGVLHRSAKLAEADSAEALETLAYVAIYPNGGSRSRRERQQKLRVRRADGTMCRVWGKDACATRTAKRDRSMPVHLDQRDLQWLVARVEKGESVLAPVFSETEAAIAATRELIASVEQTLAALKEQDGRRDTDFQYLVTKKLEEAQRHLQYAEYAEARKKAQELLKECAERQAELDARRVRQEHGEVWLNVRVPISTESRTHTKAWAILPGGSLMEPLEKDNTGGRKGRVCAYVYGDLPTNVLVVSHEDDNYGYRHTERWRVHHLPKVVTPEQARTLRLIANDSRVYFAGNEANWDLRQVGAVTVTTSYGRSDHIVGEEEAYYRMTSSLPIKMAEWQVEMERDERDIEYLQPYQRGVTYVVWHRPRRLAPQPLNHREIAAARSAPEAELVLVADGQMEDVSGRWFRCLTPACGRTERVSKSDWKKYQAGEALTVVCSGCHRTATVVKK